MTGITVRTFRELLKRKLVKGIGLLVLLLIVGQHGDFLRDSA
jgi:hypothetical protein